MKMMHGDFFLAAATQHVLVMKAHGFTREKHTVYKGKTR
jgi:hypothetical protein